MKAPYDLTGKKFGKLTAKYLHEHTKGRVIWFCECDCGGIKLVKTRYLTSGRTTSCGCAYLDRGKNRRENNIQKRAKLNVAETMNTLAESGAVPEKKRWINDSNVPQAPAAKFTTCQEMVKKRKARTLTPKEKGAREAMKYAYGYSHQWGIV